MRQMTTEIDGCPVTVIHLNEEPLECAMCGCTGFHWHAVPWYCGAVLDGQSEGGYKTVCSSCHDRWKRWSDSMQYSGA